MARKLYGGYGLTEMRRYASEYKIPGRSAMTGDELLAALCAYWEARRIEHEQAVINAATGAGALLRHKSTGDLVRMLGAVYASARHGGALAFHAEYIEIKNEGNLYGAWKGRGVERAQRLNEQQARRVANGEEYNRHMLWQYEAV